MLFDLFLSLLVIWFSVSIVFVLLVWRNAHKDRYQWCDCGRFNLKDVDYKKTKNRVHRRNICCPVRETIF